MPNISEYAKNFFAVGQLTKISTFMNFSDHPEHQCNNNFESILCLNGAIIAILLLTTHSCFKVSNVIHPFQVIYNYSIELDPSLNTL